MGRCITHKKPTGQRHASHVRPYDRRCTSQGMAEHKYRCQSWRKYYRPPMSCANARQRLRRLSRLLGSFGRQRHILPTLGFPLIPCHPIGWQGIFFIPISYDRGRRSQVAASRSQVIDPRTTTLGRRRAVPRAQIVHHHTIEPQAADPRSSILATRPQNHRQIIIHRPQRDSVTGKNLRHYIWYARDAMQSVTLIGQLVRL